MKKTKNSQSGQNPCTLLDQKTGSMLDQKTNEDYNREHPDHNDPNLTKANSNSDDNNSTNNLSNKKMNRK